MSIFKYSMMKQQAFCYGTLVFEKENAVSFLYNTTILLLQKYNLIIVYACCSLSAPIF
jgi:hypothetical protein